MVLLSSFYIYIYIYIANLIANNHDMGSIPCHKNLHSHTCTIISKGHGPKSLNQSIPSCTEKNLQIYSGYIQKSQNVEKTNMCVKRAFFVNSFVSIILLHILKHEK